MGVKRNRVHGETKMKLLEAAGPVFARVGFHAATVQEICGRAGANIAAVNYHFGDKLGLYREVLRSCHESLESVSALASRNVPAAEQLRGFVNALLTHLFGEGRPTWFAQVIAHEMAQPTAALKDLIEMEARPGFERLKRIISEISRLPLDDDRVMLCSNSVMGQCLHYFHSRAVVAELWPELRMTAERIEQIASHITAFSLKGLSAGRRSRSPKARQQIRAMIAPRKKRKNN